jgi:squalene-hopene/tetraprenyl-beta-curcumene cyclase
MDALSRSRDQFAPLSDDAVATIPDEAGPAITRAVDRLLSLQDSGGWWKGELETNVTMDAEDMLLREFLGIREPSGTARSAVWLSSSIRRQSAWLAPVSSLTARTIA